MPASVAVFEVPRLAHEYCVALQREMRQLTKTLLGTGWLSIANVLMNLQIKVVVYILKREISVL